MPPLAIEIPGLAQRLQRGFVRGQRRANCHLRQAHIGTVALQRSRQRNHKRRGNQSCEQEGPPPDHFALSPFGASTQSAWIGDSACAGGGRFVVRTRPKPGLEQLNFTWEGEKYFGICNL